MAEPEQKAGLPTQTPYNLLPAALGLTHVHPLTGTHGTGRNREGGGGGGDGRDEGRGEMGGIQAG